MTCTCALEVHTCAGGMPLLGESGGMLSQKFQIIESVPCILVTCRNTLEIIISVISKNKIS